MSSMNSRVVILGLAAVLSMASSAVFANKFTTGALTGAILGPDSSKPQSGEVRLVGVDVVNRVRVKNGVAVKSGIKIISGDGTTVIIGGQVVNDVDVENGFGHGIGIQIGG